jgi:hypothetical protein
MELLKLIAMDRDDLEVVSTHLQDSNVKAGEILWRPGEKRVVIALDRFDWEAASGDHPHWQRRRTAIRFDRVLACKCRNVSADERDKILNLLGVHFSESDSPGGTVTLLFSDGAALRLDVECLEVEVVDLGPVWACDGCPDHSADEAVAENRLRSA